MSKTHVFTPSEPVTFGSKTYKDLTFRKMKAKDLVAGDLVTGEARKGMAYFASMADVPIGVIEELDVDDFERMSEEVAPLMGKSSQEALRRAKEKAKEKAAS